MLEIVPLPLLIVLAALDLDKLGLPQDLLRNAAIVLLFLLAERFLKLPQILCKMDLKTDPRMHYHGADGVSIGFCTDQVKTNTAISGDVLVAVEICGAVVGGQQQIQVSVAIEQARRM